MAKAVGEALQDPKEVSGTFLINDSYAFVLFDCGDNKSLESHKYNQNLKQSPWTLDEPYTIVVNNSKTESTQQIYKDCTPTLDDHHFPINLRPMTIGSLDRITRIGLMRPKPCRINVSQIGRAHV